MHLDRPTDKDALVAKIAARDGVHTGLVCILAAVEACNSFKLAYGQGRPVLRRKRRKCLCLYYYFLDETFGLVHVRLTTWLPFMVQVCLNGHEWLARRLKAERITFTQADNCFLRIGNAEKARQLADQFAALPWPSVLSDFADRVNPLMDDLLARMAYYWVTDQAEFATDLLFTRPADLAPLFQQLVRHAVVRLNADDVMKFLGRKLSGAFQGELVQPLHRRQPGVRLKHRMKANWLKMYDKHGMVLRVETVINDPFEFKVLRKSRRGGREVLGYFPLPKAVVYLRRYAQLSLAANQRYLDAFASVPNTGQARQNLRELGSQTRVTGRTYRALNPLRADDAKLFAAIMRGEHALRGFRNAEIRQRLFGLPATRREAIRQSARVSRRLNLLHIRGLVARIPRTRRWRVTAKGDALLGAILELHHLEYPEHVTEHAA